MGIEEKVIFVLLEDEECRIVSGEGRMGAVSDVSAGYAQVLRVVGCLVNEVRSLKDCKVAACRDQSVTSDKQIGGLRRDVNFFRYDIFNEVREVTEREKRRCSIILRGFGCNSINDVCDRFKEVCHVLNVVKIDDKRLFRAKVLNNKKRTELLIVTGKLRSKRGIENLYIQKDLTYRQRPELAERRRKSRMSAVVGDDSSASTVGVSVASSFGISRSVGKG